MPDGDPSDSGAEPVAAESELSVTQMAQAIGDRYEEIQRIGNSIDLLLDVWHHAVSRLAALKRRLKRWHPRRLDAEDVDLDHVARLTRIIQAENYEFDLLSAIQRRIRRFNGLTDELEEMASKLKVKAWADGDNEAHDDAQQTEDRMRECRRQTSRVAEQIITQREETMDGR